MYKCNNIITVDFTDLTIVFINIHHCANPLSRIMVRSDNSELPITDTGH